MALQRAIRQIDLASGEAFATIRISETAREQLERCVFKRYPHSEWGTFFRFGFRRTSWGVALCFVDGLWPEPGELDRASAATVFSSEYPLRAFRVGGNRELGVGVVHSHPAGCATSPSSLDDDMDTYFAGELTHYTGGFPYLSLIMQRSECTGLTFSGRVFDRGRWLPVRSMFTVGRELIRDTSELLCDGAKMPAAEIGIESATARLDGLLGTQAAARLRRARIAIIGCSGTGTPVAHVLARAGIGQFVLIDPQRFSPSNHERFHGSVHDDLSADPPPFKVELLRRLILSINPEASVTAFVGNALHENVIDELLNCDLVLGCTDSVHGRVFLSDLAKHYLVPSLDLGVTMEGANRRVTTQLAAFTRYAPHLPCAFCNGLLDTGAMSVELMSDEEKRARQVAAVDATARSDNADQYWRTERQLPTVGYLTTAAGALAAGYAEGWLTGAFEIPHDSFQLDIATPRLGVVPSLPRNSICTCGDHIGWADQGGAYRNVARPPHWASRAARLP